ncbi:hypothetical protein HFP05_02870 [Rhodanobacter denitrificans]|nr:hypothetical protein [Rhodanobacter denitrificans]
MINMDDVVGRLHRASCIVQYVADTQLDKDEVGIGETLKVVEELVLSAMRGLRGETP